PRAEEARRLPCRREQEIRGDPLEQGFGGLATGREERTAGREVDADAPAGSPREVDGRQPGATERRPEERVRRQVEELRAAEPSGPEVAGRELVRRTTVGHERSLASPRDEDGDPAARPARDADGPDPDAVPSDGLDERPTGRIAPDRRHELHAHAETGEPARDARRGPAGAAPDRSRDARACYGRALR